MPTYQYSCTECGHFFEAFQNFSDDSLTVCPECEGRLRKVFNAVGVVFKGSGFYRNDSRATTVGAESAGSGNGSAKGADKGSDGGSGRGSGKDRESGSKQPAASGAAEKSSGRSDKSSGSSSPTAATPA